MEDEYQLQSEGSECQDSDVEKKPSLEKFSEKGKRMAISLAEHILMRYFFPGMKDRKKQA